MTALVSAQTKYTKMLQYKMNGYFLNENIML